MPKATLTASAWQQSWILWGFSYITGLGLGFWLGGWKGLILALALLSSLQVIRAYMKLGRVLKQLESRTIHESPPTKGVWGALDALIFKRNQENRSRISRLVRMLRGYRLAASSMPEGALVINKSNGHIVWSNKTAKRMLAISPRNEEADLFQIVDSRVKDWFLASSEDDPLLNIHAPSDPDSYLDFFLLPFSEKEALIVLRDSTKMRRLEKIRSDFVANVSHELRTPLTVIHGYLELIEEQDDPQMQGIIFEMQKQTSRMNHLVEDLLNLSRLESEQQLPIEPISTTALLHTLLQEANALSHNRHTIEVVSDFKGHLLGSHKDIHSAFSNLVSNAIRYTATGGTIIIGLESNPIGGVDFYVRDTGFGIPSDQISRLTERFYRVSSSRSRELGGTGLGLSICKHVLVLHEAELMIESIPGKGSTFRCRFPKHRVA
jgi:two-component system phosphate regulon sensor histidine kinase PhoR